jgi:uncharacterized Zn finger protein
MRIELTCAVCGKNNFEFPAGGGDQNAVTCGECGHFVGTMGDLKDAVARAVIERSRQSNIATSRDQDAG